jgi:glycosyltransferase involved in cell wall biosynthesis
MTRTATRRWRDRKPIDLLYVASGTTAGLRQADAEMLGALRELAVEVVAVTPTTSQPWLVRRYLNRSLLTIDAYESLAVRRAATRALRSHIPRAIIYSTTHAAMLSPRRAVGERIAIRFDTPAQMSRTGRAYRVEHVLERRHFERAQLLMPAALHVARDAARFLPARTPVVPVPIPIEIGSDPPSARDPITVFYGASPEKKGLDLAVAAWWRAAPSDRQLVITGINRERGLRYLEERGIEEPPAVRWTGLISPEEHRALTRRAEVYLAAARYENYGIGPLEALADGAALVTTPSPGPFAALPIARELDHRLVADRDSPVALAAALQSAFARDQDQCVTYRGRARERVKAFSREEFARRLREQVLPLLLGQTN